VRVFRGPAASQLSLPHPWPACLVPLPSPAKVLLSFQDPNHESYTWTQRTRLSPRDEARQQGDAVGTGWGWPPALASGTLVFAFPLKCHSFSTQHTGEGQSCPPCSDVQAQRCTWPRPHVALTRCQGWRGALGAPVPSQQ
jgi:hypothetical protein